MHVIIELIKRFRIVDRIQNAAGMVEGIYTNRHDISVQIGSRQPVQRYNKRTYACHQPVKKGRR